MDKFKRLILDVNIDAAVLIAEHHIEDAGDSMVYDYEKVLPTMYRLSKIFLNLQDAGIDLEEMICSTS